MSEWKDVKLGDVSTKIGSGATPKGGSKSYKEFGIALIRSQNVLDFQFTTSGLAFIDDMQADALKNVEVAQNDVLLNITGDSVARCCIVPGYVLPARVNQHVSIIRLDTQSADYRFIFYQLQFLKDELLMQSEVGATRKALTKGMLENLEMTLPPLEEQETIAGILSSLDDKIDLLHRQNQTLENIAQALFRHWFIDNAEDSWEEYRIGDLVSHLRRSVKPSDHPGEIFTHFSIPAYDNGKMPIRELGSEIRSNKYQITPFSILVSKLNPRFPRIWDIYFEPESNSICSTEFQVFRPTPLGNFGFLYHLFKSKEVVAEMQISASGTSGSHQRVSPEDILSISFLAPDQEAITRFSRMIDPLTLKRVKNLTQAQTLGKLRDTLLPKLMSGEVRVRFPRSDHI